MADIVGTEGNDTLVGTNDADTISGLGGNDTLEGLLGDDALDGGPGRDTAVYRNAESGVSADLLLGRGSTFEAGGVHTDTFTSIENLEGSANRDRLIGDDNANHLRGLGGNDFLDGLGGDDRLEGGSGRDELLGGPGNDRVLGGLGSDLADYRSSPAGIRGSLATGTFRDGFGTTDTLVSIEEVIGSFDGDNRLTGSPKADSLLGFFGNDRIDAGAGDDFLFGHDGDDMLNGGGGDDVIVGDFIFGFAVESSSDTIRGGSGNDVIDPGFGFDFVDGGGGSDTVRTVETPEDEIDERSFLSWFVDLQTGVVATAGESQDFVPLARFVSIENFISPGIDDTLFGNERANEISGGFGDDTIDGRAGADTLAGGLNNDTVDGGVDRARDVFIYNFDAQTPSANDGSDVIRNLDLEEDALRLVSGLTSPAAVDPLITVEDDGTDTTLRFVDGGASITLIGVAGPDGPFDSVSDLVDNDIVILA